MKRLSLNIFVFLLVVACTRLWADVAAKPVTWINGQLSNGIISVVFDKQGAFSILDAQSREVLLSDARFGLPRGRRGNVVKMYSEDVKDVLGTGKRVVLEVADFNYLGFRGRYNRPYAYLLYSYALYENNPALICGFGVKMPNYFNFRLRESTPLAGGKFFGGKDMEKPMTLNGSAGAERTLVTSGLTHRSANSLMLTGLVNGKAQTHPQVINTNRHVLQGWVDLADVRWDAETIN
jgi:hypothetical protein